MSKKKQKPFYSRLYLMYALVFIPLMLFGFYKNGYSLYQKDLVSLYGLFKPIIMIVTGCVGSILGGILREYIKEKKINRVTINRCRGDIFDIVIATAILPLTTNPLLIFVVAFLFSLLLNELKINKIALLYIILEGINVLFKQNTFFNVYEANTLLKLDGIDLLFGSGPGGVFSTNIFFIIVAMVVLSFNKLYKKEVVFSSILTFLIISIIPLMVMGKYDSVFPLIFGYNILFILVFIAPNLYSSCYTVKGMILSGIMIGIITYGLWYITPYTAAILAVLIVSILRNIIDRIFVIK